MTDLVEMCSLVDFAIIPFTANGLPLIVGLALMRSQVSAPLVSMFTTPLSSKKQSLRTATPLTVAHHKNGSIMFYIFLFFTWRIMGEIDCLKMECQANSPPENRPLKPPRTRRKVIYHQQS